MTTDSSVPIAFLKRVKKSRAKFAGYRNGSTCFWRPHLVRLTHAELQFELVFGFHASVISGEAVCETTNLSKNCLEFSLTPR